MTRSFFLLRDTSIVEIFSSEKTTSPVCVPFCIFFSAKPGFSLASLAFVAL